MAEQQARYASSYYDTFVAPVETRAQEIEQAVNSDYPALALCRLKGFGVIEDAEAELKKHLANDLFTYVTDLESRLQRLEGNK